MLSNDELNDEFDQMYGKESESENKIAKANKQIDLSLRKVVKENRKKMKPAVTDEEIGLQILAQGQ